MALSLTACGNSAASETNAAAEETTAEETTEEITEETTEAEPEEITETAHVKIDGIYVDDSYSETDSPSMRMVYVFYEVFTDDVNMESFTTNHLEMTINSTNTYESSNGKGRVQLLGNWFYKGDGIKEIYVGDRVKAVSTLKVPEGELAPGREITFGSNDIPDIGELKMKTDSIVHCESQEAIAEIMDPEGIADYNEKQQPADEETVKMVKSNINDYQITTPVGETNTFIWFYEPNTVEFGVGSYTTGTATYTVKKGFISWTNDTGATIDLPWYLNEEGKFKIDTNSVFNPQLMR